jgi:hypothetical protein
MIHFHFGDLYDREYGHRIYKQGMYRLMIEIAAWEINQHGRYRGASARDGPFNREGTMSRLSIVTSSVVALLAGTMLSISATAQQTLRQQLVGTWTMTSCDVKAPWCVNGKTNGSFALDGNGRYTEVILAPDRPKLTGTGPIDPTTVSAEAYKGIGQGTVAQIGTWSVDEANKTLTLRSGEYLYSGE